MLPKWRCKPGRRRVEDDYSVSAIPHRPECGQSWSESDSSRTHFATTLLSTTTSTWPHPILGNVRGAVRQVPTVLLEVALLPAWLYWLHADPFHFRAGISHQLDAQPHSLFLFQQHRPDRLEYAVSKMASIWCMMSPCAGSNPLSRNYTVPRRLTLRRTVTDLAYWPADRGGNRSMPTIRGSLRRAVEVHRPAEAVPGVVCVGIEAVQLLNGCQHVLGSNRPARRRTSLPIGCADHLALRDPGAGKRSAIGIAPVLTAARNSAGHTRGAAMLGNQQDQRLRQRSPLFEIVQDGGINLVERRAQAFLEAGKIVGVRVQLVLTGPCSSQNTLTTRAPDSSSRRAAKALGRTGCSRTFPAFSPIRGSRPAWARRGE